MNKLKQILHHNSANTTTGNNFNGTNTGMNSYIHPLVQNRTGLPPQISNWQPNQPVPQGWRVGRKGFLKPMWSLPSNLSSWQQGQPIPEGYRIGKRGTLRPINYTWSETSFSSFSSFSTPMETDVVRTNVLPAEVEIREKAAVVQEIIRPGVREEIQPVIHREREQLEIREEIQPIYEKSVRGTIVEERQLAPEFKPEVRLGQMPVLAEGPRGGVVVEAEQREVLMNAPIVEEVVHRKIIEEIQPVIHREVIAPRVIHETKNIYEKIIEAPVVTYSTLPPRYSTGLSTGFQSGFAHPMASQYNLPAEVLNWQSGQAVPQGWRLGNKGYLKPIYTLPSHLQNWQQGQPIPEGYRVGKKGMLKPINFNSYNNNFGSSALHGAPVVSQGNNQFMPIKTQQANANAFIPAPVQRF